MLCSASLQHGQFDSYLTILGVCLATKIALEELSLLASIPFKIETRVTIEMPSRNDMQLLRLKSAGESLDRDVCRSKYVFLSYSHEKRPTNEEREVSTGGN